MCFCIFVSFHTIIFQSRTVEVIQTGAKTEIAVQDHSFKVMHFGITKKPTTDCISPYNNAGLISKVSEKIASRNAENCCLDNPTVVRRPLPRELP